MSALRDILALTPVLPVIVLERVEDAVPLARALVAGGIRVLEVTMRTAAALPSVAAIRAQVPDAVVGVGTVTNAAELAAARAAGAVFGVSPGTTSALLAAARESGWPFLPGVMTPSEVIAGRDQGFDAFKLFPAAQAGGKGMLKALAGPFPELIFCPTGGVDAASAPELLALPNVACVGGSWLAPEKLVRAQDWAAVEALARAAAGLRAR